ncbi:hypothetical protein C8R43DRAFT_1241787 [Mycena crocata]|nr:hypothetical protein C8R43DRAFT_1241787 [Mycena crocata]
MFAFASSPSSPVTEDGHFFSWEEMMSIVEPSQSQSVALALVLPFVPSSLIASLVVLLSSSSLSQTPSEQSSSLLLSFLDTLAHHTSFTALRADYPPAFPIPLLVFVLAPLAAAP